MSQGVEFDLLFCEEKKVIGKCLWSQVMCYLHFFTVDKLINSSTCETPIFNRHFCLSLKRKNNLYYKTHQLGLIP